MDGKEKPRYLMSMIRRRDRRATSVLFSMPLVLFVLILGGCMVNQHLVLSGDGSGTYKAEGGTLPFAALVFDDLAFAGGYENADALYQTAVAQTKEDLSRRSDISDSQVEMTSPYEWKAVIHFRDIESLLGGSDGIPIAELSEGNGTSTLTLNFDRKRAAVLETFIPLLGEPALTAFNPAMTQGFDEESYIADVLSFTFGEENIPAVKSARIAMDVTVPGPITALEGGTKIDNHTVRFETAFTRLIVPEIPIHWSVSWKTR